MRSSAEQFTLRVSAGYWYPKIQDDTAFSELDVKRSEQTVGGFCRKCSPVQLKDKFRLTYAVKGQEVVIAERRPRWDSQTEWTDTSVAKLKFIRSADKWRLYWMRADLKWHEDPGSHRAVVSTILRKRLMLTRWPDFSAERIAADHPYGVTMIPATLE